VTAVRNKVVVIPTVDADLNCIYKTDLNTELDDGETRTMATYNLSIKSRIQYTMVNSKTVFICVPPLDGFGDSLSI